MATQITPQPHPTHPPRKTTNRLIAALCLLCATAPALTQDQANPADTINPIQNLRAGDDTLRGSEDANILSGFAGNDRLFGGPGNDILEGGAGNDLLKGEDGRDRLFGQADDDHLDGGSQNDLLRGGRGKDRLIGGPGNDHLHGELGNDILVGGPGHDHLAGGKGNDHLIGGTGRDHLRGGTGNDRLRGWQNADILDGGDGDDTLRGGKGNDHLDGGPGQDRLTGGPDQDTFRLLDPADTPDQADLITDFTPAEDRLIVPAETTALYFERSGAEEDEEGDARTTLYTTAEKTQILAILRGHHDLTAATVARNTPTNDRIATITTLDAPTDQQPTRFALTATALELPENASTQKLANIQIEDDGLGENTLKLTGNTNQFELQNNNTELWLKPTTLDYETAQQHQATITLTATGEGPTPPPVTFTLTVTDIDEAPTAVQLTTTFTTLSENAPTQKLADIQITDDALGTNTIELTGDTDQFELQNKTRTSAELWLKPNSLDYEFTQYHIAELTLTASGEGPALNPITFSLLVTDHDEPPTFFYLSTIVRTLSENAPAQKLADIYIQDDALGTNTVTLSGDTAPFEIRDNNGQQELWLKPRSLNYQTAQTHHLTLNLGTLPSRTFALTVTQAPNQQPTAFTLANQVTHLLTNPNAPEQKLADIQITDDGKGRNSINLSGPDAIRFELRVQNNDIDLWLIPGPLTTGTLSIDLTLTADGDGPPPTPNPITYELKIEPPLAIQGDQMRRVLKGTPVTLTTTGGIGDHSWHTVTTQNGTDTETLIPNQATATATYTPTTPGRTKIRAKRGPEQVDFQLEVIANLAAQPVTAVSAGSTHSCAINNGALKCWGSNASGQLGDGTTTDKQSPTQVTGLESGVTAVSTGENHTCAIHNQALKCWGANTDGQLGDGTSGDDAQRTTPTPVTDLTSAVTAVSAGSTHTCAIHNQALKCWGSNANGRLGDGSTIQRNTPTPVTDLGSAVTAVSAGAFHTCAIHNAALKCWGSNFKGRLADGTTEDKKTPTPVTGLTAAVTAISVGRQHSCAIHNQALKCWGSNFKGQLGDGTFADKTTPTPVTDLRTGVTAVSTGLSHSCAIQNAALKCWGNNEHAQLGDGTTINTNAPIQPPDLTTAVTALATGDTHSCAIHNGTLKCWGKNASGQLGDSTTARKTTPTPVTGLEPATTTYTIPPNTPLTLAVTGGTGDITWHTITTQNGTETETPIPTETTATHTPDTSTPGTTKIRAKRGPEKVDFTINITPPPEQEG